MLNEVLLVQDAAVDMAGGKVAKATLHRGVFAVDVGTLSVLRPEADHWLEWPFDKQKKDDERLDNCDPFSIQGVIIASLARSWGCSLEELIAVSSFSTDENTLEREVGIIGDKPYVEKVDILRRPQRLNNAN